MLFDTNQFISPKYISHIVSELNAIQYAKYLQIFMHI